MAETATALDRARRAQAERTARLASQTQALKQLEQQAAESPLQALQQRRTGLQAAAAGWYRARELQREAAGDLRGEKLEGEETGVPFVQMTDLDVDA